MLVGLNTTWAQPQATARWYHGVSPRIIISRGTRVRTGAARPLSAASCGCPLIHGVTPRTALSSIHVEPAAP